MKNLIYYINKKYHLRNLYFEINEKLKKLISTEHSHKEQFGIIKIGNEIKYKSFACVFEVIYFNKETFEYDLKIVTTNKEKYIYKFKEDTKFVFEIDKSGYAKEIKI